MRGVRVCAVAFGIAAGACATGSDAPPDPDTTGDVEAGDATNVPGHDASHEANENDGSSDTDGDVGAGNADDSGLPDDGAVPVDSAPPQGDDASADATTPGPDASDGGSGSDGSDGSTVSTNVAPTGHGYTWQSMTSATANTGRLAAPVVNDNSLSTQADIDSSTGDNANAWEGAGVVFTTAVSVSSVSFVQGTTGSSSAGDGWFEAGFALQLSKDGATWSAASWSASPPYAYSSAVSGKTYVFSGAPMSGILGVRVVGQVNTAGKSWWAAAKEVMVFSP